MPPKTIENPANRERITFLVTGADGKVGWAKAQRCPPSRAAPNTTLEWDAHCVRAPQCSALI